ncbi:16S rRNA (cytidine(1402)-2'-O)-methyltransferase [Alkalihalobacillus hwajinpoensis]|uniref:16S rRNA (cytidine(1402)-2'-O)-methyltransferase n=1 Tax=Guptibacillus hwajinpoensis TaxID=208199 RepID=UPI001883CB63|nr:16S rRNA (cytidine(1402)-2'-O)-methyltransferase [Pseudalkalibacillus hwajinpoensis]MBF0709566.1 16S rRNA (cytidine(1402)-2'-O)-methyltransferase [Pseudalkalibacillus hwajinpoensis]
MWSQKSYKESETGKLYLVPTPIGNLNDMTFRAIQTLKDVDLIAAEDTRQSKKLTNHFEIETRLISYHEHNKESSGYKLLERLREGQSIALISDAGMPAISDPGYEIVSACVAEEIPVIPLPGANAAITALVASGLPTQHFYYYGFLSRQKKERKIELQQLKTIPSPVLFYEAPHRLKEMMKAVLEVLGNREIIIARELTKKYEEFIRGSVEEVLRWFEENEIRGEFCVIVEGGIAEEVNEELWWEDFTLRDHVEHYINDGMKSKDAIKQVSIDRELPKREVYQAYHVES